MREKQALFELRSHNFNCKSNFSSAFSEDMSCRTCGDKDTHEDESHSLSCISVVKKEEMNTNIKFDDIFGSLNQQVRAIKYFLPIIQRRAILLDLVWDACYFVLTNDFHAAKSIYIHLNDDPCSIFLNVVLDNKVK